MKPAKIQLWGKLSTDGQASSEEQIPTVAESGQSGESKGSKIDASKKTKRMRGD